MAVTFTAVIITKNEARNIGRCLRAVEPLVDEIIVIDSHSSDETAQICAGFPKVKFETCDWAGYSATKNYANSRASGDYLLSLDADEEISPALALRLQELKSELTKSSTLAFEVDRLTNYCGQWIWHSGWRPDYQLRLFPRGQAQWDGAEVHETMQTQAGISRVKIKDAFLFHYSYYSIAEHIERVNKYSSLGAEKIVRKGKSNLVMRAIFNSVYRFFKAYFIKLGFLDGFYGFVIAVVSAYAVFLKYAKAQQIKLGRQLATEKNQ
jgi:glycosyltransferase involved in cell wall biosynthesis